MGKIRRVRQKFHQSSPKFKKPDDFAKSGEGTENQLVGKSPLLKSPEEFATIPDNLFEGIDIDYDSLKKKLVEDDRVSVRSIAKSCKYDSKGKLLTKKERQKLKHDLFMRKINTVHQLNKEALQKQKKRKGLRKNDVQVDTFIGHTPLGMEIGSQSTSTENFVKNDFKSEKKVRQKGIQKAKVRQQEMLKEISAFRKILCDPKFAKDPCTVISECIQERIVKKS